MSRRVVGRSFKITKNQAKGYGYAKARSLKPNPGVTTIAAINGRGSYRGRSARSAMSGLNANARAGRARRKLTEAEKRAFKARMAKGRAHATNRSTSSLQSTTSKRNIRKAQSARKAWGRKVLRGKRIRVGSASYGRKPKARKLKAGVYIANRRKKAESKTMARRRKRATTPTKKRRSSKRRRKSTTKSASAPKRRRRRKAARKGAARKRTTARKTVRRRRRKASTKLKANPKRRRSRKVAAAPKKRRSTTGRKRRVSRKRRSSARRKRAPKRSLKANRRRRHRRNPRKLKANSRKRRSSGRRKSHRKNKGHKANRRRRHRRNGRKLFKMNGVGDVVTLGLTVFGGFAAHRFLTNLFANQVLARLMPAPAAPAATAGFDLSSQSGLIASLVVGVGGSFLASKVIKNPETKKLVIGGMVASTVHGVVLSLLKAFAPSGADMLSGPEDGTAARLGAAMYGMRGLGSGASVMPRYGVINGMGEYFREPMNGLGEYFREPMNGLGEYISATSGLGTYEANGDLYQAAAGMGTHDYQGNHIDPSGDLDRQLTIAEAAAGVGALSPFEAAAGIGPMQAAAGFRGFGAIDTVASGDTWIPGSVEPQLWAGAKAIDNGQSATEMTPAGVLQTDGGQGIFG